MANTRHSSHTRYLSPTLREVTDTTHVLDVQEVVISLCDSCFRSQAWYAARIKAVIAALAGLLATIVALFALRYAHFRGPDERLFVVLLLAGMWVFLLIALYWICVRPIRGPAPPSDRFTSNVLHLTAQRVRKDKGLEIAMPKADYEALNGQTFRS